MPKIPFHIPDNLMLKALRGALSSPVQEFQIAGFREIWEDEYGKMGDKWIPILQYSLPDGSVEQLPIFVKRNDDPEVCEATFYQELSDRRVAIPDLYFATKDEKNREMLFMEVVGDFRHEWPWDGFRMEPEFFPGFIEAAGTLNGISSQEPLKQLRLRRKSPPDSAEWKAAIRRVIRDGKAGILGEAIRNIVSRLDQKGSLIASRVEQICDDISQMPCGVIHDDLYPFQVGVRKNGDVVIFDLHDIKMGPRSCDMGLWLGAPDEVQERCLPQDDLIDIYLGTYCREGLEMHPSSLKAEAYRHWQLKMVEMIDHWYSPAAEGKEYGERLIAKDLDTLARDLLS